MSLVISANNPFRSADWRWRRAHEIHLGRGLSTTRRRDGTQGYKWISRALTFLRELDGCGEDDRLRAVLAERRPDIFWAHWAWSSTACPQRHSIEAQILARCDDYAVGFRCGVPPTVIEAYEALFFNVREKLQHRGYILHCVLGPSIQRGISEREYDLLWKLYGYFLGPHIVAALESKFSTTSWCGTPDAVGSAILDDAISTLKLKAAVAAKTVAVNHETQLALMEAFTKFVEVERNTDSAGKAQSQILDHISAMMTSLPFNVGGRSPHGAILPGTAVQRYEKTAIELTYEETMRLSVDQPIAHEAILRALAFPEAEPLKLESTVP